MHIYIFVNSERVSVQYIGLLTYCSPVFSSYHNSLKTKHFKFHVILTIIKKLFCESQANASE